MFKQIIEDLGTPYRLDPAVRSRWEVLFNYPGVWAVVWYRLAHNLHNVGLKLLARYLSGFSQFLTSVDIHPEAQIGRRVFIDHGIGVVIGQTAIVGDDVTIYQGVTLGGVTLEKSKRHPTIENGAVIGSGAKVLGNITIGEDARIGANSVVVRSVPARSTAVGIPAKVLSKENEEDRFSHDNLPDINKELFVYLIQKVQNIENCLSEQMCEKDKLTKASNRLREFYDKFIHTIDQ